MSSKYTEAFDSLKSDENTKKERLERILSAQNKPENEITVQTGSASAAKARSAKRGIALVTAAVILCSVLCLGLYFGLKNNRSGYDDIYGLMKNVKMINEDLIGFSLSGANDKKENGLIAIKEDLGAEEVRFKKINGAEEISNEDISRFGAITQFFVMNNLLFIEITEPEAVKSDEVEENDYFSLGYNYAAFAVDLNSKNVYSVMDAFKESGAWDESRVVMYFSLEHGLLRTNPGIVGVRNETYYIDLHDNKLELIKVADTAGGEYLQDKYKNIYLIEDEYLQYDLGLYNFGYIDLLTCDGTEYEYFTSTDKQVYRAKKSDCKSDFRQEYYYPVESLQADKSWKKETTSSDKILRNQVPYSTYFQGGEWMLKDGRLVRIVDYPLVDCYNVDGKILAHIKNRKDEAILYLCDENRITEDFKYIDLNNGYAEYEKVVGYETDSYIFRYNIQSGRTGHILSEYSVELDDDAPPERYRLAVKDGKVGLMPIEPVYNGLEIVNEIIFLS